LLILPKTVVAIFDSRDRANQAINELRSKGFDKEISLLTKDEQGQGRQGRGQGGGGMTMGGDGVSDGATTGGVLGGLAGLAIGAGALVIPGLGPLIAAGPIAGLFSGAATGGIAGGLIDWGIPEQEGKQLEEDVKSGKMLVTVRTDKADEAAAILRHNGANKVKIHG
jgi:uncharacterized membrane protein